MLLMIMTWSRYSSAGELERTRLRNDEPRNQPRDVLTKPKILPVAIEWERVEPAQGNKRKRYVLSAASYQRLVDAVPKQH